MLRRAARIRNFYDDPDGAERDAPAPRSLSALPVAAVRHRDTADEDDEPTPQSCAAIHPTSRVPASPTAAATQPGSGGSSASIEDVIACPATPASCALSSSSSPPPPLPSRSLVAEAAEYVSLRELEAAVAEARRDVRRLRALMVKAVWLALTDASEERTRPANTGHGKARDTATARREADMAVVGAVCGSGAYVNTRPFLPPDRYPTLPDLDDSAVHLQINLSRALSAARTSGLLEKQRTWMLQRQAGAAPSTSSGAAPAASARATALQRVSALSAARGRVASSLGDPRARQHKKGDEEVRSQQRPVSAAASETEAAELRLQSSVSLVVLRVAKDRAVAALFLRQLRLDTYRRQALYDSVELRYRYYVQRRALRGWLSCARAQQRYRHELAHRVVQHWVRYVTHRRALHAVMHAWRRRLGDRACGFAACRTAAKRRCLQRWARALTWRRERSGLYESATKFAATHGVGRRRALFGGDDVLALLEGRPVAAGRGVVVATAVGHRLLLHCLFQRWKGKAERRLMARLAAWFHTQRLRRSAVRVFCSRSRTLALRDHRVAMRTAVPASATATAEATHAPPPPLVCAVQCARRELFKYKTSAAATVARAAQLRKCFRRWSDRACSRRADRFCLHGALARALRGWLHALTRRQQQRQWVALVWQRWVTAVQCRRDAAAAARLHAWRTQRRVLVVWHTHWTLRLSLAYLARRSCFDRWRERAAVRAGSRVLVRAKLQRLLGRWRTQAQVRADARANLYVAATLWETGMLLGCVRRWRARAEAHHRTRLARETVEQLRVECVRRRCFARWQRRTFGPTALRIVKGA